MTKYRALKHTIKTSITITLYYTTKLLISPNLHAYFSADIAMNISIILLHFCVNFTSV